jgi:hypothetical protein
MLCRVAVTALALGFSVAAAAAQELEPRAYSPTPVGATFLIASATRSSGGVLTDPTLPIDNVDATLGFLTLAAGHTFSLAGRQAFVVGAVPITWAKVAGDIGEDRRSASRRGLADPRFKLSVILRGSPAMTPAEFARTPHRSTIVGASISVVPPLGQYDKTKLINLGANRWSFKPEVGISKPVGRWVVDGYAGVWLFTANESFYTGDSTRTQNPIVTIQAHVSYMLTRRAWVAFDGTWYSGGRTNIDGVDKLDLQRSSRIGATVSLPIKNTQSLKIAYSSGATTRIGGDFRTVGVSWQMVIF